MARPKIYRSTADRVRAWRQRQRAARPPADGPRRRAWTAADDDRLRRLATEGRRLTWAEVGGELGRSAAACERRARVLNIPPCRRWDFVAGLGRVNVRIDRTTPRRAIGRKLFDEITAADLGGLTAGTRGGPKRRWSAADDAALLQAVAFGRLGEVADELNRSAAACRRRARMLKAAAR